MATERTRLLVDAGLSRKETFERLHKIDVDENSLTAILITHEHSDHIAGLQVIAKKLNIPIYVSRLTAPTIPWPEDFVPKLETFAAGSGFTIGDIDVTSFTDPGTMPKDPVGFTFQSQGIASPLLRRTSAICRNRCACICEAPTFCYWNPITRWKC